MIQLGVYSKRQDVLRIIGAASVFDVVCCDCLVRIFLNRAYSCNYWWIFFRYFGAGSYYSYILIVKIVAFVLGRGYRKTALLSRNADVVDKLSAEINLQ